MLFDAVQGLQAYLADSPLAWLTTTLAIYMAANWLFRRSGNLPLLHPVFVSVLALSAVLWGADIRYEVYFEGAQFIHFFLGPVTVLLAVPLYKSMHLIRQSLGALGSALVTGSVVASVPAVFVGYWLGADDPMLRSLVAKSVTTPVALGITETLGGINALTAVIVVFTGVFGGMFASLTFRLCAVADPRAQGLALGLAAHGIGVGRALQIDTTAAAFATLAMALNALLTTLWVPAVVPWLLDGLGLG